jgi:chromosome segregation ATPase
MKTKIGVVILAAVCIGLLIALLATKKAAEGQRVTDEATISSFSNQLVTAHGSLDELNQDNIVLSNYLATTRAAYADASNNLVETSTTLAAAQTSLQGAQDQITNLNSRLNDLQLQNQALDAQVGALSNTIVTLDSQIADTQQKLATTETNNIFLTGELQKQMAQKAELEHRFNDLDAVRAQVRKLRDEAFTARRLQWMNDGTSPTTQPKGGEILMKRTPPTPASTATNSRPQFDLNVEVGSDGSVHVIPPHTNSAAH